MDALGHVNNTVYLRFFEEARIVLFDRVELRAVRHETRIGPILASTSVRFLRPLVHPDTVLVETGVRSVGQTSFVLAYQVTSRVTGGLAATGDSAVVMYDYARGEKVRVADDLRARLLALPAPDPGP
jgi:acyl-CoA thioester hydrolase